MNYLEQKILALLVKTKGKLSKPLFGGLGHILMLHRVLPDDLRDKHTFNRGLAITPSFLEESILFLKNRGYQFISLDDLTKALHHDVKLNSKFVCLTLDDGYRDNLIYGLPIFKKYRVPVTIYVTNCFPNHSAHLWWYWLEEKIENESNFTFKEKEYSWQSEADKLKVYNELRVIFKNSSLEEITEAAAIFFNKSKDRIIEETAALALSWEEIKEINQDELVSIGAHTLNHLSLKNIQSLEVLKKEILDSKAEIELKLNERIKHFAYPYGGKEDAGIREFILAREAGFDTSTMNYPGNIFIEHRTAMMTLPRYPLGNSVSNERFEHYLNGIYHFGSNQFQKTIKY